MADNYLLLRLDWISISLRWLTLLGFTLAAAMVSLVSPAFVAILLGAAVWNATLTILAGLGRRLPAQATLSILIDAFLAYLIFFVIRPVNGALLWIGLLPLISASIYYGLRGALLSTAANLIAQSAIAILWSSPVEVLFLAGMLAVLYTATGLIFSLLSNRLHVYLRSEQEKAARQLKEMRETERERQHAIYTLITSLSSTLKYQRVLESALDQSAQALATLGAPADQLVSAFLLFKTTDLQGTALQVGSARRMTAADMRLMTPGVSGLVGATIEEGHPRLGNNLSQDPELGRFISLRNCNSAYCLPLRTGLDTYGVLLFAHPDENFFTPENLELLDIVTSQATNALQNARLYNDLELEKERMLEIQEEARKKMARDLHDGPTQSVAAIAMRVNFARRLIERDPKGTAEELYKIEDLARRTTKEIRHMLFTLRPLVLESQGLIAALESMAEKTKETYSQDVVIQADPKVVEELEPGKQAVVFYIAEEAVNNARKHARAEQIWVRLKPLRNQFAMLEIEDNGTGFDLDAVDSSYENRGSLGMVNMRERAELVNGLLHLESQKDKGTLIQMIIPLNEEAADQLRRGL